MDELLTSDEVIYRASDKCKPLYPLIQDYIVAPYDGRPRSFSAMDDKITIGQTFRKETQPLADFSTNVIGSAAVILALVEHALDGSVTDTTRENIVGNY